MTKIIHLRLIKRMMGSRHPFNSKIVEDGIERQLSMTRDGITYFSCGQSEVCKRGIWINLETNWKIVEEWSESVAVSMLGSVRVDAPNTEICSIEETIEEDLKDGRVEMVRRDLESCTDILNCCSCGRRQVVAVL